MGADTETDGGTISLLAPFAAPIRWIGYFCWAVAALAIAVPAILIALGEDEPDAGQIVMPAVFVAIGQLLRLFARSIERGGGPELPVVAGWAFSGVGMLMLVGGIVLAFADPGGFALIVFGLVFLGAGLLARKLFATPEGKRKVAVSAYETGIRNFDGTTGTRRQGTIIHVDEDATEEEIEAAKDAWRHEQWKKQRPDWAAGRIVAEDERSGRYLKLAAVLWSVFTAGAVGAGFVWGGIAWYVAVFAGLVTGTLVVLVVRMVLRQRRFAASHLVLERSPARLGDRLTGEIVTGVPQGKALREGFVVQLRCIHTWEETDYEGRNDTRRRLRHRDILWETEQRTAGYAAAERRTLSVPVDYELPSEQPPTTLGGHGEGIVWELAISAAMPGIDYRARFQVPVFEPGHHFSGDE